MKQLSFKAKVYISGGVLIFLVILYKIIFSNPVERKESTLFGSLQLKTEESASAVNQESEKEDQALRYKVRVKKENPFLSLYQEKKEQIQEKKPVRKPQSVAAKKQEERGFFNVSNGSVEEKEKFFKAVFRGRQVIQAGKAVSIVLVEPIPALDLQAQTVLKGIPQWVDERILIKITASVTHRSVKKVSLTCYDPADMLEGIYYDAPSNQLEDEIKESIVDRGLGLDFRGKDLTKQGVEIARKYKKVYIEKDREVFVTSSGEAPSPND